MLPESAKFIEVKDANPCWFSLDNTAFFNSGYPTRAWRIKDGKSFWYVFVTSEKCKPFHGSALGKRLCTVRVMLPSGDVRTPETPGGKFAFMAFKTRDQANVAAYRVARLIGRLVDAKETRAAAAE